MGSRCVEGLRRQMSDDLGTKGRPGGRAAVSSVSPAERAATVAGRCLLGGPIMARLAPLVRCEWPKLGWEADVLMGAAARGRVASAPPAESGIAPIGDEHGWCTVLLRGCCAFGVDTWAALCGRAGVLCGCAGERSAPDEPLHGEGRTAEHGESGRGGSVARYAVRAAALDIGGRDHQLAGMTGGRGTGGCGSESACWRSSTARVSARELR